MTDIKKLVSRYALITDQVSQAEVVAVLSELDRVLAAKLPGDVVEFGCYKGTTSLFLARLIKECRVEKKLWLYDSFMGLPDKSSQDDTRMGDEFQPGALLATKAEVVQNFRHANLPRPIIKKGWFSEVTPADVPEQICFAYFDGDYYNSIRDSFRACQDRFVPGAIIVIDDYTNDHLPGAARAVDEWVKKYESRLRRFYTKDSLAIIELC